MCDARRWGGDAFLGHTAEAYYSTLWRSLPYFRSGGRRSTLESAPIYITLRKKTPTWRWGQCARPVSPPFRTTPRAQNASSASRTACYCRLDAPRGPEEAAIRVRREGV